jgi:hypothetical protein
VGILIALSHTVFNPLKKMGFFLLYKSKTSLKKKVVNGEYLASEFDNLFYDAAVLKINKHDVIPFTNNSTSLEKSSHNIRPHSYLIEFSIK